MRADRLVSILLWLQVRGRTSTSELARRLEVSDRTILRDMDALTTAGIPVLAARGRRGGWMLPEEYRTTPRWLSAGEVGALAILSPAATLAALGIDDDARSAWLKLQAALPPPHRARATLLQERIHVDSGTWKPSDERLDWLILVHHAVQEGRMLWMRYVRANGTETERVVAPLGLVAKGSAWYLVGLADDQLRTYRVSRIEAATIRPDDVQRPPGFDLAAYWESSKAELQDRLPAVPVTLRVAEAALSTLRDRANWARIVAVDPVDPSGWLTVRMTFELKEDAIAAVLGMGAKCEMIAPSVLRDAVITHLRQALDQYHRDPEPVPVTRVATSQR
jgi:predicted DNA-binding transcriptional regulator YafY